MAAVTAFRSAHPDVLAGVAEWGKSRDDFDAAVAELKAELGGTFPDRGVLIVHHSRETLCAGFEVLKSDYRWSDDLECTLPDGWRIQQARRGDAALVPYRTNKAGKQLWERIRALRILNPFSVVPGMPGEWWPSPKDGDDLYAEYAHRVFYPSLRHLGTEWWSTWSCRLPDHKVDQAIWTKAKLSEYHAALEAHEADTETVPAT